MSSDVRRPPTDRLQLPGLSARICATPTRLIVYFTCPPEALENEASNLQTTFQGGGGVDIMIEGPSDADPNRTNPIEGDLLVLLAGNRGKMEANVYPAVAPLPYRQRRDPLQRPMRRANM